MYYFLWVRLSNKWDTCHPVHSGCITLFLFELHITFNHLVYIIYHLFSLKSIKNWRSTLTYKKWLFLFINLWVKDCSALLLNQLAFRICQNCSLRLLTFVIIYFVAGLYLYPGRYHIQISLFSKRKWQTWNQNSAHTIVSSVVISKS